MQRRILSDPNNLPHRALIDVGPEKLDLLASAIHDAQGEYVGAMISWGSRDGEAGDREQGRARAEYDGECADQYGLRECRGFPD